jgi:hypothetical protein
MQLPSGSFNRAAGLTEADAGRFVLVLPRLSGKFVARVYSLGEGGIKVGQSGLY